MYYYVLLYIIIYYYILLYIIICARCAWLVREIINLNPYSNRLLTTELVRKAKGKLEAEHSSFSALLLCLKELLVLTEKNESNSELIFLW